MIRRFALVMNNVKGHAVIARELSAGLYEAVTSVMRRTSSIDEVYAAHQAQIQRELPGF